MKTVLFLAVTLFATSLSVSATTKADHIQNRIDVKIRKMTGALPWPNPNCGAVPPDPCPAFATEL